MRVDAVGADGGGEEIHAKRAVLLEAGETPIPTSLNLTPMEFQARSTGGRQ